MTMQHVRTALVGGLVADGTGSEPRPADVLLARGRIEAVVPLGERPQRNYNAHYVECSGQIIAPGFVDIHCHSDLTLLAYPGNESRVTQGVTTEVVGNCGMSPAPGNADSKGLARIISTIDVTPDYEWKWSDVAGWLNVLEETPTATNVATQVGHGSARFAVAGTDNRALTGDEMDSLATELEVAFEAGCVGVSVGLMYAPGGSAAKEELKRVAEIVAAHNGVLSAHLRDYRSDMLRCAIDELAGPAGDAGSRLQISHLRSIGGGKGFAEVVQHVDRLREDRDVEADIYPYVHGHTTLLQLLPAQLAAAGLDVVLNACITDTQGLARYIRSLGYAPEQIIIMKALKTPEIVGSDITVVDGDPWEWLITILIANRGLVDVAVESGRWADVDLALRTPWVSVASDGAALDASHTASAPHPRSWGAFSAAYRRLRTLGTPVGETVRRMSTLPAARIGLKNGIVAGRQADLIVFDEERFASTATFHHPASPSVGLDHVYVNGVAVLQDGRTNSARPGALIRKESDD